MYFYERPVIDVTIVLCEVCDFIKPATISLESVSEITTSFC